MRGTFPSWLLLLSLSGALAGLGCHSSASDDAAPIARADYCSKLAKDACTRLVSCCNAAGITTDDDTCLSREQSSCESQATIAEAKGYVYEAQAAGNCLEGAKMFHQGCATRQPGFWESRKVIESCARIFHGTARLGDPCKLDDDCAPAGDSIVGCQRDGKASPAGKCVAIARANRGDKCNLQPDGATAFVGCHNDAICVGPRSTTGAPLETRCAGPAAIGQPCNSSDARTCADGLICDPEGNACTAPRAIGEKCGAVPCASPYVCQWTTNRCVAKLAVGERCRASDLCVDGAACVGGACRELKLEGDTCTNYEECLGRTCKFTAGDASKGVCGKAYGGSVGGVDTSACRVIQVK